MSDIKFIPLSTIAFLPIAGDQNPYQKLMIEGLKMENDTTYGVDAKLFPISKTFFATPQLDYLHFDWIHRYYITKYAFANWVMGAMFVLDICIATTFLARKAKIVWTLHNMYPHLRGKTVYDKVVRSIFVRLCYSVRVFSEQTKQKACKEFWIPPSKVHVIPEGSYVSYYNALPSEKIADIQKEDTFTYLYAGEIKRYKGVLELIRDFESLKGINARLVIVGKSKDTELMAEIKKARVSDRIILLEKFIKETEFEDLFALAHVVVCPFLKVENSGTVILAMGYAKPVLAPKMGVLRSRLSHQSELLYTDLKEGLEFASALSKETLNKLGEKNRSILENYKWSDFNIFFH